MKRVIKFPRISLSSSSGADTGSIINEDNTAKVRTLHAKIKRMEAQEAHMRKRYERLKARLGFSIEDESPRNE